MVVFVLVVAQIRLEVVVIQADRLLARVLGPIVDIVAVVDTRSILTFARTRNGRKRMRSKCRQFCVCIAWLHGGSSQCSCCLVIIETQGHAQLFVFLAEQGIAAVREIAAEIVGRLEIEIVVVARQLMRVVEDVLQRFLDHRRGRVLDGRGLFLSQDGIVVERLNAVVVHVDQVHVGLSGRRHHAIGERLGYGRALQKAHVGRVVPRHRRVCRLGQRGDVE